MSDKKTTFAAETQQQRWLKYGANVGLSIIVVIVLAMLLVYLAQRSPARFDTTGSGLYSLKPQTLGIIKDLKSKVTLVSLYTRKSQTRTRNDAEQLSAYATVEDLLREYQRKGSNIDVQIIDPVESPAKADALIKEVSDKYGGEIQAYKSFLESYTADYNQIRALCATEKEAVSKLPLTEVTDRELVRTLNSIIDTVDGFPPLLEDVQKAIQPLLKAKPPDYKGAVDAVQQSLQGLSERLAATAEYVVKLKDDAKVPASIKQYFVDSTPRFAAIKKLADDTDGKIKQLGDLKLDTLRQSLRERDSILVMGEKDLRVIRRDQVWREDLDTAGFLKEGKLKPRFAGEQIISTAVFGLAQPKKIKIAIVRPGGAPLASAGFPPFEPGGPLSLIAERLREYNFEVLEKDLSGTYAMQAQMRGMQAEPEPTDEQIKDAIWVVVAAPMGQSQMGPQQSPIGSRLAQHLQSGGSAMVLPFPDEPSIVPILSEWGVDVLVDTFAAHEQPKIAGDATGDVYDELLRAAVAFNIQDYGDHPLTKPLRSLSSLMAPILVVKTNVAKDVKTTPIIPIPAPPNAPPSWGEAKLTNFDLTNAPTFDADKDVAGPLWGGAAAEKRDGGRLVVIAAPAFAFDQTLRQADPQMRKFGLRVTRFPGNAELFTNSIFWLARMDTMLAISPAAMDVSRISDMSPTALSFVHNGVLLVGLPGLALVAGFMMYLSRRD